MARSYTNEKLKEMATTLAKRTKVHSVSEGKSPKTNEPWVGVEIEFYTEFEHLHRMIANSDIIDYITIGEDGSIHPYEDDDEECDGSKNYCCWEMKVCAPEDKIKEVLGKVCSILRYIKAQTNSTCGLHIHLDHRLIIGRNPVVTFNNLLKLQNVMFGVADESRNENEFCNHVDQHFYDHLFDQMEQCGYDDGQSRYWAINLLPLRDYNTIEVRVFNSTTKYREIMHFVNLALGAVRSKTVEKDITEKNVDIVKTIPVSTRNYVKSKMRRAA